MDQARDHGSDDCGMLAMRNMISSYERNLSGCSKAKGALDQEEALLLFRSSATVPNRQQPRFSPHRQVFPCPSKCDPWTETMICCRLYGPLWLCSAPMRLKNIEIESASSTAEFARCMRKSFRTHDRLQQFYILSNVSVDRPDSALVVSQSNGIDLLVSWKASFGNWFVWWYR